MSTQFFRFLAPDTDPANGSVLYWTGTAWVPLAPGTSGLVLTSAGSGAAPAWTAAAPGGVAGGDLGGTYPNPTVTDLTIASEARGDILYRGASGWVRLAAGTSGQQLQTAGASADPAWASGAGLGIAGATAAAAGFVGEYVESVIAVGSAVGALFVSTEFGNITSISLTAGNWDVTGMVHVQAGTFTAIQAAVSVNTGNTTTDHVVGSNATNSGIIVAQDACIASYRLALADTTTVFLKAAVTGTPANIFNGRLSARRMH